MAGRGPLTTARSEECWSKHVNGRVWNYVKPAIDSVSIYSNNA